MPTATRRFRSSRTRILLILGLALLMITGIAGVALRALTARYDGAVPKEELLDPSARKEPDRGTVSGPLNYLLVGSDERPKNPDAGQRADTIMIAHVPEGMDQAYLISVPRDLLVQIPPHPATGYAGGTDKVNSAFQYGRGGQGGSQLLSATLTRLTGIRFDGAAIINFAGFRKAIDLVGGIEMCVDTEVRSIHTGAVFTPGCHQMNGAQALDFARQRYNLPGGDFDRQRHQQQLLRALVGKVTDTNLITNPVKADQLLRSVGSALIVDTNGVSTENLVFALRDLRPEALTGLRMPAHSEMINETSYTVLDEEAGSLFRAVRTADVPTWVRTNPEWVNPL